MPHISHTAISPETEEQIRDARVVTTGWLIRHPDSPYSEDLSFFYKQNIKGQGITIGLVDSGVDANHPMLKGRISGSAFDLTDSYGHGTAMSAIIVGKPFKDPSTQFIARLPGSDAVKIIHQGVAPAAKIRSYRVLDKNGEGHPGEMAKGILRAVADGVDIINISAGINSSIICLSSKCKICRAVRKARRKGILVLTATGNDGPRRGSMACPASHPATIAVGSEDSDKNVSHFSGISTTGGDGNILGPGGNDKIKVDGLQEEWLIVAVAPGSTLHKDWEDLGKWFQGQMGTSPATAFVTGLAALLLQQQRELGNNKAFETVQGFLR